MVVGGRELIDTLWNVNSIVTLPLLATGMELIDTLWNVNCFESAYASSPVKRINRYIMECK